MTDKREQYVRLIGQGMSNSAACRSLGIDRKTGHWWKNGGVVVRNGVTRIVKPVEAQVTPKLESGMGRVRTQQHQVFGDARRTALEQRFLEAFFQHVFRHGPKPLLGNRSSRYRL